MPLGDHSAHWANLLGEIVREFPMHFDSWSIIPAERKAGVLEKIGTRFNLKPHMQSELWPDIRKGIDQHLGKIYMDNKSSLKRGYWVKNLNDETYDVEAIRYVPDPGHLLPSETSRHIPGVSRVLAGRGKDVIDVPKPRCNHNSDVDEIKRTNRQIKKQMDMIIKVVRSDDKMS
ncbi:hypothetical protein Tco_1259782 [Tanacetum coccineum]